MASPSPADRVGSATSWTLVAAAVLALCGAVFIAQRAVRASARSCWGDIVPDAYVPSPSELARLPKTPSVGPRLSPGVAALGEFELHFVPVYHRFGDTDEIAWQDLTLVDPSSCSERAIPLDRGRPDGMIDYLISVYHDDAHGIYIVHTTRTPLAVFRRHPAPGVKHLWTSNMIFALMVDGLSGVALLAGLARAARARPGGTMLAISLLLSVLGAIFGLERGSSGSGTALAMAWAAGGVTGPLPHAEREWDDDVTGGGSPGETRRGARAGSYLYLLPPSSS